MLVMRTLAAEMRRVQHAGRPRAIRSAGEDDGRPVLDERPGATQRREPADDSEVRGHARAPRLGGALALLIRPPANLVGLTASGRRVMARVAQQAEQHVGLILSRLTASERADITRALARLSALLATPDDSICS